jgi:hypothetical protein
MSLDLMTLGVMQGSAFSWMNSSASAELKAIFTRCAHERARSGWAPTTPFLPVTRNRKKNELNLQIFLSLLQIEKFLQKFVGS